MMASLLQKVKTYFFTIEKCKPSSTRTYINKTQQTLKAPSLNQSKEILSKIKATKSSEKR